MQFKTAAVVLASAALVQAQSCPNGLQATFNLCVSNALGAGNNDAFTACTLLQNDQPSYYKCLCDKFTAVNLCYSNFCSTDPGASASLQQQTSFCGAVSNLPVAPASTTSVPAFTLPSQPTTSSSTKPSSSASPTTSTSDSHMTAPLAGAAAVVAAVCAMLF
ncbi:uncharacterized protein BJ171DRAFT_514032 [Polychytrium aggregatum]|uniref:uncharacterized protein n=1 Tax=Polychytrium aggregatum TaxID=110093 RepID=UPI0022FED1F5|nr:uncharacterized protein BJ171DRAFT_514032 [Polychytrium aggregatum]KAI9202424.1 hypothetical protein BJ171DRAFT_514032 [Polychytrium aggregatum]